MAAGVADAFCITQMTFETVDNALLAHLGLLCLTNFEHMANFWTCVNRLKPDPDFPTEVVQFPPDNIRRFLIINRQYYSDGFVRLRKY